MKVLTDIVGLPISASELIDHIPFDPEAAPKLQALIEAAVSVVETATNRPMMRREVEIELPACGWSLFWLPCAPVIALRDAEGAELISGFNEPRIRRGTYAGETIIAEVGYEHRDRIPRQMRQAVILLVKEWLETEISVGERYDAPVLSFGFHRLIKQVKYTRPQVLC
ncbi:hypothetical protein [Paracoccus seriniphilus]|uniref:Phage gp6-like head-tail connector protein n=1 Tax=Paracoccus seriniphilus TaxID=184748 RepID=A0A239Q439_9RHOB|nr:hypothetical protein [Paracoccus seriniphilus]WCR13224.1 hypothetical protein JHW44_09750 [Paracoccus seriniphilus]SNT76717.1 hypothetical protein SAMN05444959_12524 [Paracoccus seriniphilus]